MSVRLPVRVISVGNFEAGGTGKTPVVAQIAREAVQRGLDPVILSRGYRGRWEKEGGVIAPQGVAISPDPMDAGDEPALLHELVPEAWIGVGFDRVASFRRVMEAARALGRPSPKVVILDDGLQHHRIQRDLDLILVTSHRPWTKVFREFPLENRRPSELLVWTKGADSPFGVGSTGTLLKLRWKMAEAPQGVENTGLWLVTGVADGRSVRDALEAAAWRIESFSNLEDHVRYTRDWVESILQKATDAGLRVATTGKDWVKWKSLGVKKDSVIVFEPEILLNEEGRTVWLRRLWGE